MYKIFSRSSMLRLTGIVAAVFTLFLYSCEKEVKIDLAESDPQLVVEGAKENGVPPYVILTNSLSYFSTIDLTTLQNNFIHGAEVKVSNGSQTIYLKEYALDSGSAGAQFYIYSVPNIIDPDSFFVGEIEKTYQLTIKVNGKVYEASTKIPNPTPLDSVVSAPPVFNSNPERQRRQIKLYFKDPDSVGNYMRYFTSRNSEPYYPGPGSVFTDEVINGKQFQTVLPLGESPANTAGFDSLGYAYPGDTVTLKWCAIDKRVYEFYSTFEYAIGSLGNPFSSPTRLSSNISNKAIGIWAGYGCIYTEVVIR